MMIHARKLPGKTHARNDEGWTFIEAAFSIVLLTVVFLGFSLTLLTFREWMDRSWAIRAMDQYANDLMSRLNQLLLLGSNIGTYPNQYGLGSFWISVYNFQEYPQFVILDSTVYSFSAQPTNGVFVAEGNAAPEPFVEDFPLEAWEDEHRFVIEDFGYQAYYDPARSQNFNESMGQIFLTIRYERLGGLDFLTGAQNDEYMLRKNYRIATFMKNHVDQPD